MRPADPQHRWSLSAAEREIEPIDDYLAATGDGGQLGLASSVRHTGPPR